MTPIEQQFQELQGKYPKVSLLQLPSGAHLITVENVKLPIGWNQSTVTVLFVAPPGFRHRSQIAFGWSQQESAYKAVGRPKTAMTPIQFQKLARAVLGFRGIFRVGTLITIH